MQAIPFITEFFHVLQLRPYSLPAVRLNLLIFPVILRICIIVFLISARQTYPVYQILHFFVRFVKVCFCYDFSAQPYHNFFSISVIILSIFTYLPAHFKGRFRALICPFLLF